MHQANKLGCNMCFNSGCSCITCLLHMPINTKRPYSKSDLVVCTECGTSHDYNDWEHKITALDNNYYELIQFYKDMEQT